MPSGPEVRNSNLDTRQASPLRYTNKDGSKYITVPRKSPTLEVDTITTPSPIKPPRTVFPPLDSKLAESVMDYAKNISNNIPEKLAGQSASTLIRKKKKKKAKAQLRREFETTTSQDLLDTPSNFALPLQQNHTTNGPPIRSAVSGSLGEYQQDIKASLAVFETEQEDMSYSDDPISYESPFINYNQPPQTEGAPGSGKKKNKKKKKKNTSNSESFQGGEWVGSGSTGGGGKTTTGNQQSTKKAKDRIWNTSTNEERERIKEFWLSLGEDDRRSLVKVEKEAVLKKMKEQQKHSCSCSVCGRKRTAIEEELEVLYDAYYEELEQYANQQQSKFVGSISPLPPHFSTRGPPPPSLGPPPNRIEELEDDDDDYEDDDEYEEDDEDAQEDEHPHDNDPRPDFLTFGNSLMVQQGGVLTVADDLLKNDGKKFIEMMEQLAERRMQREEEAASGHLNLAMPMSSHGAHPSNHPPQSQEYEDDEEDEEDEDDYEDDYDEEEDEPDPMTEEQRMEEGRKMFQIFAARMFEQRVLQAYREKVAQERQRKLLEELEEENRLKEERELRRVKEKERKKDRKRQQKLAKEEEKLKKEAEKAAEEAAQKALEEKKAEEVRKRREEQRLKKEAERKAAEEERLRKEEEKKRRQQEEREREVERERKRKEHQERERKKKEEATKKVKEEKEAREKEAREKREKEERERRAREAKAKKHAEEEKTKKEDEEKRAVAAATNAAAIAAARAQQNLAAAQNTQTAHHYHSPRLSIAAPAVPKQPIGAPAPARPRQPSQQGSVGSSPKTPQVLPRIGSSASPNAPNLQQSMAGANGPPKSLFSQTQFSVPSPNSPIPHTPHTLGPPPGVPSPLADATFPGITPMAMNGPAPYLGSMPQRQAMANGVPMFMHGPIPISSPQYRGFANTNGLQMPILPAPGLRPVGQAARGAFMNDLGGLPQPPPMGSPIPHSNLPMFAHNAPFPMGRTDTMPSAMHTHTRSPSGSFDVGAIQRPLQPAPIQRPQSAAPKGDDLSNSSAIVDDLSNVLGSRALIDDDSPDVPFNENISPSTRRGSSIFGSRPNMGFGGLFGIGSQGKDPFGTSPIVDWGPPLMHPPSIGSWTNGAGWSDRDIPSRRRRGETRLDQIRLLACKVCQEHSSSSGGNGQPHFLERSLVLKAMSVAAPPGLIPIDKRELDDLVEVEGDSQNGGGSFVVDRDQNGNTLIKFEPGNGDQGRDKQVPVPGEIGSPSIIGSFPSGAGFSGTIPPMGPPPGIGGMPSMGNTGGIRSGFSNAGGPPGHNAGPGGGGSGFKFGSVGSNASQFMA